jgi:L-fuculose-phosphate aldolase
MAGIPRRELLEVCRLVYDRFLTDAAGSNFCVRASDDTFYVTPTGNAKRTRLRMTPDDILLLDRSGKVLDGRGTPSSSWPTHRAIMEAFPGVKAIIHAHPKWVTAYACRLESMPPVLDAMKPYGSIPFVPRELVVDGPEFGKAIVAQFRGVKERLTKIGAATLYPFHGTLTAAPTLEDAFDLLERMEFNAAAINYPGVSLDPKVWDTEATKPGAGPRKH